MKHWQELASIVERLVVLERDRCRAALASVTKISGSAYRRPGARLLIEAGGSVTGGVSGGCLEEDVRQVGLRVIESARGRLLDYDTRHDASKIWGLGLGCDGEVQIQVLPVLPEAIDRVWAEARSALRREAPLVVATALDGEGHVATVLTQQTCNNVHRQAQYAGDLASLEATARQALDSGRSQLTVREGCHSYHDVLQPPPQLLVCGAGDDSQPLVALAATLGFRVVVLDHRAALLTEGRFPGASRLIAMRPDSDHQPLAIDTQSFAVVKMHALEHDTQWVRRLAASRVVYIGVLGPQRRLARITEALSLHGDSRLHGPVGLDLGADGPEQVAVSILSEILALRSGRKPVPLREAKGPLRAE